MEEPCNVYFWDTLGSPVGIDSVSKSTSSGRAFISPSFSKLETLLWTTVVHPATISDVEEDDQSDLDSDAEVTEDVGEPDDAVLDDDMEEAGELTAQEHLDRFSAVDPTLAGFSIVSVVPAITNDLIGKPILFKFDDGAGGTVWYKGKVKMKHKHTCDCGPVAHCDLNFDVKYSDGVYPQQLRSENDSEGYGSHNLWVLLEKSNSVHTVELHAAVW